MRQISRADLCFKTSFVTKYGKRFDLFRFYTLTSRLFDCVLLSDFKKFVVRSSSWITNGTLYVSPWPCFVPFKMPFIRDKSIVKNMHCQDGYSSRYKSNNGDTFDIQPHLSKSLSFAIKYRIVCSRILKRVHSRQTSIYFQRISKLVCAYLS